MIDIEICDKGFIWNPNNCECESNKSWDFGEFLDNESYNCRKSLIGELVEECGDNGDGNELIFMRF